MFKDVLVIGLSNWSLISFTSVPFIVFSCYLPYNAPESSTQANQSKISCTATVSSSVKGGGLEYKFLGMQNPHLTFMNIGQCNEMWLLNGPFAV